MLCAQGDCGKDGGESTRRVVPEEFYDADENVLESLPTCMDPLYRQSCNVVASKLPEFISIRNQNSGGLYAPPPG